MAFGLYLHIPYCLAKCRYCDFYSKGGSRGVPQEYVDALVRRMDEFRRKGLLARHPDTVYFGGGTPSLLTPEQAARLIAAASPAPGAEVTLEANPETVNEEILTGFLQAGVNRLSLGVQTAFDESLARLGRPHTAAQSREAFRAARQAGFANISGDIMMALPQYTREEFDATLELIASGGATHISAYLLKIEPGTAFGKNPPADLPDEDAAADFYLYGVQQLEQAGFAQYEISNFARPGFAGRHNLLYWNCQDYLGLGPAAHSCVNNRRFYWPGDTHAFLDPACQPVQDGGCGAEDYILLQLRLTSGLDLNALKSKYSVEFSQKQLRFVEKCVAAGYARFQNGVLSLTPSGLIIQNSILCELLD